MAGRNAELPGTRGLAKEPTAPGRAPRDLPSCQIRRPVALVVLVSGLLTVGRREIGTRKIRAAWAVTGGRCGRSGAGSGRGHPLRHPERHLGQQRPLPGENHRQLA